MNFPGELVEHPDGDGYICSECRQKIPTGEDCLVAMEGNVMAMLDGQPRPNTFNYAGIYHWECVNDGE